MIRSIRSLRTVTLTFLFAVLLGTGLLATPEAFASPEYARQTGQPCRHCHVDALGGGQLTKDGAAFLADLKGKGLYRPLSTMQHIIRFAIGYLHMLAAIVWFGTIMYVHILLKPAYASKGLPKGELRLGWLSMVVLLVTGILLTVARIASWEMLFTSRFGILLTIKICLFLVMLGSAVVVTTFIGPRLRQSRDAAPVLTNGGYTADELLHFDGRDGRPAYVAYAGRIYDVTNSRLWKNGSHVMKHSAGRDLTAVLGGAPHGPDKVLAMPPVGELHAEGERKPPLHLRLFYFFAYMNLALVFVITFIIALWRWW